MTTAAAKLKYGSSTGFGILSQIAEKLPKQLRVITGGFWQCWQRLPVLANHFNLNAGNAGKIADKLPAFASTGSSVFGIF
jgi:hypothetical protein